MRFIPLWSRVTFRFPRPSTAGDERGGALLRYLLVFMLVAVVFVVAFTRYGHLVTDKFDSVADRIRGSS